MRMDLHQELRELLNDMPSFVALDRDYKLWLHKALIAILTALVEEGRE